MMLNRGLGSAASVAALVLVFGGLSGWAVLPAAAAPCASDVPGDVNGDGQAEAVVGESINGGQSGGVHVFYGQPAGLVADATGSALNDQFFTQNTTGVPGASEAEDQFGLSNVLADFNGDDCADLAVGVPGENGLAGAVTVLYGSSSGVTTIGAQSFTEDGLFGPGSGVGAPSVGEQFGHELSYGDLNDDGFGDLVVGAPFEMVGTSVAAGGVVVIYGAAAGLGNGGTPATLLTQAGGVVPGIPEDNDDFGTALAIGDFNGNGVDDLAAGVPGEDRFTGIVQVLPGQAGSELGTLPAVTFSQDTAGVAGIAERRDGFGSAVAAGDVTDDGRDDLAVGAPGENGVLEPGGDFFTIGEGAVSFLRGSASGLTGQGGQIWSQSSPGVAGVAGKTDEFGASLVISPLDNGPLLDLAIGTPSDAIGSVRDAGSVTILLGRSSGLSTAEAGGERFSQDTAGMDGVAESEDTFGSSVAAPFIQTTGEGSLLIGVPGETVNGVIATGLFHQLSTSEFGPSSGGSRTFHLASPGVKGIPHTASFFGLDVN
jgi:hypothetical protein